MQASIERLTVYHIAESKQSGEKRLLELAATEREDACNGKARLRVLRGGNLQERGEP